MPRRAADGAVPRWDALYDVAAAQAGYFTVQQARDVGCSPQLLQYHLGVGHLERSAIRGVRRLVRFPPSDREDLVPVWLWSRREGIFGVETALAIHQLSDVLPAQHDLIVPAGWAVRRVRTPRGVRLFVDDVHRSEWRWSDGVPVTTPARTLRDCFVHHVSRDLVEQAVERALRRKLVSRAEVHAMRREAA